jgi:hypothetical protein
MIKSLAVAALLCTALQVPAFAQDVAPASPYDATTQRSTQEKVTYPNGTQVEKSTNVESGNGALSGSSTTTVVPPAPPPPVSTTTTYQSRTVTTPPTVTTTTTTPGDGNN